MSQRDRLLEVVSLALASASALVAATPSHAASQAPAQPIECFGINSCKGTNGCAVGKAQIKVANEVFANRFAKSAVADCAGTSECAAKSGHLAWINRVSHEACFKDGGFVFEKDKKGQFVIRDKSGVLKAKA